MNDKERIVQEAVGSLKVTKTQKTYYIQYVGPKDRDPGFLVTIDSEQIPFTTFEDIMSYFAGEAKDTIWEVFVSDDANGEIKRDKVKRIEMTIRITHTDA